MNEYLHPVSGLNCIWFDGITVIMDPHLPQEVYYPCCNIELRMECSIPSGEFIEAMHDKNSNKIYVSERMYQELKNNL